MTTVTMMMYRSLLEKSRLALLCMGMYIHILVLSYSDLQHKHNVVHTGCNQLQNSEHKNAENVKWPRKCYMCRLIFNVVLTVLKLLKIYLFIYLFIHSLFWIALSIQCTGLPRGPDKLIIIMIVLIIITAILLEFG